MRNNKIEIAWLNQPGRLSMKMASVSDGFQASPPYASVVVVAECEKNDPVCAMTSAAIVRDTFAEGVAYGVEDALHNAFDEVVKKNSENGHDSCSIASIAVLGCEVRVVSTGTCHAFLTNEAIQEESMEGSSINIDVLPHRFVLKYGQSVILVTHGLRKLIGSVIAARHTSFYNYPLAKCLEEMVAETRIRFKKKGGSIAAVRFGSGSKRITGLLKKYGISIVLIGALVLIALSILCNKREYNNDNSGMESPDSAASSEEIVMPLNMK